MGKHKQEAKRLRKQQRELLKWLKARRNLFRMLRDDAEMGGSLWATRNYVIDAIDMVIRYVEDTL